MKKEFVFRLVLAAAIFFLVYQFGIKPIISRPEKTTEADRQDWSSSIGTGNGEDYDVVVYGAEPQGIAAAISAARLGARTLLISENAGVGGTVAACLLPDLELPYDGDGKLLNGGILEEMSRNLGTAFSDTKYIQTMDKMLKAEKKLNVLYSSPISGIDISDGVLKAVKLFSHGQRTTVTGRMFIDTSNGGSLLNACKVPYFTGSGDLNLENSYMPVGLNFEMTLQGTEEESASKARKLTSDKSEFYKGLKEYKPLYIHSRINQLSAYFTEKGTVLFTGLQIADVNVSDAGQMSRAYGYALAEAKNMALFLSNHFPEFKGCRFKRAAQSLYAGESRHYEGKYRLSVNDVLNNRYFDDTVSMGSYPVLVDKFAAGGVYIAGSSVQYGIPLGCLIPERITNLLMGGPRISYSSLAATSAGTMGTSIATGEAAGSAAIYCLAKNESPAFLANEPEKLEEFRKMLIDQKMALPNKIIKNKNSANWSYPAVQQLISLGLIAGGTGNDFSYDSQASQKDLATILLNGIYRLDKKSYSLDLDARIRPFISGGELTYERAVKILGALYGIDGKTDVIYHRLCAEGRINDVMQLRFKDQKGITMDAVYYLGAYTIRSFTGKDIPD